MSHNYTVRIVITVLEYQSNSETVVMPMISLGFKETESVEFGFVMKDFILVIVII